MVVGRSAAGAAVDLSEGKALGAGHDGEVITMRDVFVSVVVGALVIGALALIMFLDEGRGQRAPAYSAS